MHVLVVGGTRFVGRLLVQRLVAREDRVTILHRGRTPHAFGDRVETLLADRGTEVFDRAVAGRRFDAVVDFAAYDRPDVERAMAALDGRMGHYVFVSTGQVYLVRAEVPVPAREEDYDGALKPRPVDDDELGNWEYGVGKRACEDAIVAASSRIAATRVRIPVVHGERDPERRLARYLDRLADGGPVLVPDGGDRPMRHVYCADVASAVASLLGDARTFGNAYNFSQDETPTLRDVLASMRGMIGSTSPLVAVPSQTIVEAGLVLRDVSPLTARWMSQLDASRAKRELGFVPTSVERYLGHVVAHHLATASAAEVDRDARAKEIALARAQSAQSNVAV